jgi:hypothetical protein
MQRFRLECPAAASSFVVMLKGNKTVVRRNCERFKSIVKGWGAGSAPTVVDDHVAAVRDFRYVPYIAREVAIEFPR